MGKADQDVCANVLQYLVFTPIINPWETGENREHGSGF